MQFIKSLIFNFFIYTGLIVIFILAIPTLILPVKFTIFFGRLSAKYIVLILKLVMNTKVIFHGKENLKKVDNFFVASAHQSLLETFALQIPLNGPIFILKKELRDCYAIDSGCALHLKNDQVFKAISFEDGKNSFLIKIFNYLYKRDNHLIK